MYADGSIEALDRESDLRGSVVGRENHQEMEQMMRDKLQQRTKTGQFQLRKTFKYSDQDTSFAVASRAGPRS